MLVQFTHQQLGAQARMQGQGQGQGQQKQGQRFVNVNVSRYLFADQLQLKVL